MTDHVLAVLSEFSAQGLSSGGREALGLAGMLAAERGAELLALLPAGGAEAAQEAAESGARRVFVLHAAGNAALGELLLAGAAEVARREQPSVIVVGRGPHALELAPRLAARLSGGCVMNAVAVEQANGELQVTAAIFGGAAQAVYRIAPGIPAVLSPTAGAAEAPPRAAAAAGSIESLAIPSAQLRVRVVRPEQAPEGPRLEDAHAVVSGGRGLSDRENFGLIRELAAVLGGMPGASRAIVDDGWARPEEQVGLTGKIVTPQLYLAIGISGASQHMAGCSNAGTLVAINTDAAAPIFRYARLGIADDCLALLPELIRQAKQRPARG